MVDQCHTEIFDYASTNNNDNIISIAATESTVLSDSANPADLNTSDRYVYWTPRQALTSRYGIFNLLLSTILTLGINVGAMYGSIISNDYAGVWVIPPTVSPYGLPVWGDWLLVCEATWLGAGLLSIPGDWASIKYPTPDIIRRYFGLCNPIDSSYVTGSNTHWIWKCTGVYYLRPRGWKHFATRTVVLALLNGGLFYGVSMVILAGVCDNGNGSVFYTPATYPTQCWWTPISYIWIKSAWATLFSITIFPIALVSGLSADNCPPSVIAAWKRKQYQQELQSVTRNKVSGGGMIQAG